MMLLPFWYVCFVLFFLKFLLLTVKKENELLVNFLQVVKTLMENCNISHLCYLQIKCN